MPGFPLADAELDVLAKAVHSWNASAFAAHPAGDLAAGRALFETKCLTCHMALGKGASNGPDLSGVGKDLTVRELEDTLRDPNSRKGKRSGAACPSWAFCPDDPWGVVSVKMKDGSSLRGFARSRGPHDVQLQTFDREAPFGAGFAVCFGDGGEGFVYAGVPGERQWSGEI